MNRREFVKSVPLAAAAVFHKNEGLGNE